MTRNLIALAVASLLLPCATLSQESRREPCQNRQAEANKAVVARAFQALDQGDLAILNDVFDPKGPIHSTRGTTTLQGGPFTELSGSCPMCANLSSRKITIDMMVSEGDLITVRSTWTGKFTGKFRGMLFSGKDIRIVYTNIYRIAGGRIVENWYTTNGLDVADQLGIKLVSPTSTADGR